MTVLGAARLQPTESVSLADALGRTLAEPLVSRDAIPPFDNSAMDGFAVRTEDFADGTAELDLIGEIPAGQVPSGAVRLGTCVRIMTGAPVPDGADAVAPVEWTEEYGGRVAFKHAPEPGQYVRRAGEEIQPGYILATSGAVVTPFVIGMAATLGYGQLAVRVPPMVAVVTTGNELVDAGTDLAPGQIRDANGPALAAQVVAAGGRPVGPFRARDDEGDARRVLGDALEADIVVVSGGVSMGDRDIVRAVLDDLGVAWDFWKVRQRPGKPLAFGARRATLVFGLPGNPVSSAVCFEQYVRPVLGAMLGRPTDRRLVPALLTESIRKAAGLHHFVRGVFDYAPDGRLRAQPTGEQGSGMYSSMTRADGFIHLPEEVDHPEAGTAVDVEWLAGGSGEPLRPVRR